MQYYKSYIVYRDSINNINSVQKMADLRTAYEVSQKQVEVNLLNQQKRNQRNLAYFFGRYTWLSSYNIIRFIKK